LLRIHAAVNKNRKEQSLPLHHDLAKALQQQKPANSKADDLVLVNGVPKMKEFRQDLAKAGIPFLDERGHRMDYHALRTTFITRLSTMKVHPRLGDGTGTAQRYAPDDEDLHGRRAIAVARSDGHVAGFW
jgi:hypothetical protein